MLYFDTSFLTPLFRREDTSVEVRRFLRALRGGTLAISPWMRLEFSSLIARDVRMEILDTRGAMLAITQFEAMLEQTFRVLPSASEDFALASRYIQRYETKLRAGDALHLAIAKNNGAEAIYSLDKKMIVAGKMLGLPISRGIRAR